jgi:hypothetical protein
MWVARWTHGLGVRLGAVAGLVVVVAVVSVVLTAGGSSPKRARDAKARVPFSAYSRARNTVVAKRLAARMGDGAPSEVLMVDTTRGAELKTLSPGEGVSGGIAPSTPVRVYALRGSFTDSGPTPHGSGPPPKGTWLAVAVDIPTARVVDVSLTDERPDLRRLGNISRLIAP